MRKGNLIRKERPPVQVEWEAVEDKRFEEYGLAGFKAFRFLAIVNNYSYQTGDSRIQLRELLDKIGWSPEDAQQAANILVEFGYLIGNDKKSS